jgi:hypothetical protein
MAAILPRQFHEKKQMAFENQQDLKFNDQGGINDLPSDHGKLDTHNMEMPPVAHFWECQCWWNGSHSSCPQCGEMLKSSMQFNVNQPGWNGPHAIKTAFGVVDKRPLLCVNPAKLVKAKRKRLANSLAVSSWIWWV